MTADACRPGGYFAISAFAQARFSSVNVKFAGCSSFGARRRTDIVVQSLSLHAAGGIGVEGANPVLPEGARGTEHVIADVGRNLDAVKDRKVRHGFQAFAARIIDDQL